MWLHVGEIRFVGWDLSGENQYQLWEGEPRRKILALKKCVFFHTRIQNFRCQVTS